MSSSKVTCNIHIGNMIFDLGKTCSKRKKKGECYHGYCKVFNMCTEFEASAADIDKKRKRVRIRCQFAQYSFCPDFECEYNDHKYNRFTGAFYIIPMDK